MASVAGTLKAIRNVAAYAVKPVEVIGQPVAWLTRVTPKVFRGAKTEVSAGAAKKLGPSYEAAKDTVAAVKGVAKETLEHAGQLDAEVFGATAANYAGKGLGYAGSKAWQGAKYAGGKAWQGTQYVGGKLYDLGTGTAKFMTSKKFLYPAAGVTAVAGGLAAGSAMLRSSGDSEEARAIAAERAELAAANERLMAENHMREAVLQNATQQVAMAPAFGTPQMPHNMTGTQLATAGMALDGGLNVAQPQHQLS